MHLKVAERLALLEILPAQGDITSLRIVRELRERLTFTSAEHDDLSFQKIRNDDGTHRLWWNPDSSLSSAGKPFAFSTVETQLIRDALETANKKRVLKPQHVTLYEKFIEGRGDTSTQPNQATGTSAGVSPPPCVESLRIKE